MIKSHSHVKVNESKCRYYTIFYQVQHKIVDLTVWPFNQNERRRKTKQKTAKPSCHTQLKDRDNRIHHTLNTFYLTFDSNWFCCYFDWEWKRRKQNEIFHFAQWVIPCCEHIKYIQQTWNCIILNWLKLHHNSIALSPCEHTKVCPVRPLQLQFNENYLRRKNSSLFFSFLFRLPAIIVTATDDSWSPAYVNRNEISSTREGRCDRVAEQVWFRGKKESKQCG